MEKKKERNSNIELLRIISIFFIIVHHYALHNRLYDLEIVNINKYIGIGAFSLGKIGVNIFIIITGYFLINKDIAIKKLLKLWLQIFFYSLGIAMIFYIFKHTSITPTSWIKIIMPISFNRYWFITVYFFLYLFIPIINEYISKIDKERYKKVLLIFFIILVVTYSLAYSSSSYFLAEQTPFSNLIYFVFLYLIGGYIKKYKITKIENMSNKRIAFTTLLFFMVYMTILCVCEIIDSKFNVLGNALNWYTRSNSIFVFIISVFMFCLFKNMNIKNNKIINFIASTCFGTYLIQSHTYTKAYLYKKILKTTLYYNSIFLIVHMILSAIVIIIIGAVIDLIRQYLLEKNIFNLKFIDKICNKIDTKIL